MNFDVIIAVVLALVGGAIYDRGSEATGIPKALLRTTGLTIGLAAVISGTGSGIIATFGSADFQTVMCLLAGYTLFDGHESAENWASKTVQVFGGAALIMGAAGMLALS